MLNLYTVTQGKTRITVQARSGFEAIDRALEQLQHIGGISAKKVGAA
ncbi:hypothetical protein [Comamonas kerstersii]|nr:hypothetical protein [Comamonas kerstersii]